MIRYLTAGESHGKALTVIVDGMPSNAPISSDEINHQLKRRQQGYGRGMRMKIETDTAEVLSGIRFGKTLGSPISLLIRNMDWENWTEKMSSEPVKNKPEQISIPRPGHADLTGTSKYNFNDIRNSIERSSARETAARVAAGSVAMQFLRQFNIEIGSYVESLGGIYSKESYLEKLLNGKVKDISALALAEEADKSEVRVIEDGIEDKIINKIKAAKKRGDTLGGTFVTVATGVPAGLGSFVHYDRKLDAEIASAFMSINAVKGVAIGGGFDLADTFGSESHDEIIRNGETFSRKTNRAGGIEGGISNGLPIIVRAAMKPIATLMSPIESVDLKTMQSVQARRERSDFTAVPACAVIGEAALAWSLAKFFLDKFGGDSLEEIRDNYENYTKKLYKRISRNFK